MTSEHLTVSTPTELISAAIGAVSGAGVSLWTYRVSLSHQRNREVREQLLHIVDLRAAQSQLNHDKPANFLDIGGGASAEVMANGLEIILGDPSVRSVFVNVFGGITACDAVANGIVQAFGLLESRGEAVRLPLVVRLDGNNAEEGRRILTEAALPGLEQVDTMDGAAERVAELAGAR